MAKVKANATKPLESKVESQFIQQVKANGGWAIKFWPITLAGFPDRIVLWPGARVQFVELKRPGEEPRALQRIVHKRLARYGFNVFIIHDYDEVIWYVTTQRTP